MIHGGVFGASVSGCSNSSDPEILWTCSDDVSLTVASVAPAGPTYPNLYFYELGGAGYYLADPGSWLPRAPSIDTSGGNYSTGEFLVKWEIVSVESGDSTVNATTTEGVWGDAFRYNISIQDTTQNGIPTHIIMDVTVATDNGAGAPVAGTESTKRIAMIAHYDDGYDARDTFSGITGTQLTSHTPTVGGSWTEHSGDFEINSNTCRAVQNGGANTDNRAVIDAGVSDCSVYLEVDFNGNDTNGAGIVFRAQDANNHWLLKVDTPVSDPTLKLIEVSGGTPTVRDSQAISLATAFGTSTHYMRVQMNGSAIRGQLWTYNGATLVRDKSEENCLFTVEYTSSFLSTETSHGIYTGNETAHVDDLEIFGGEVGVLF